MYRIINLSNFRVLQKVKIAKACKLCSDICPQEWMVTDKRNMI